MGKVILVGVNLDDDIDECDKSIAELEGLAGACDMQTVGIIEQTLDKPNGATCIGPGKVTEVKTLADNTGAEIVIFDYSLSPSQIRNLQSALDLPIMDRSSLILEIFASRARSREAKLQVEVARLQYLLPRLVGMHAALSRQGGGSGATSNKGTGEKKLELDRRVLEQRLVQLRSELENVEKERNAQCKKRASSGVPRVALVGYTNAGKSTLLNAMIEKYALPEEKISERQVETKDMLFATLDTTVRKISPPDRHAFLLSDTVGFIDKLPHNLVDAFRSTLEEAKEADVLLQVIDYSDENFADHMDVTRKTLNELGAGTIPMIYVYNKADMAGENVPDASGDHTAGSVCGFADTLPRVGDDKIYMSARDGTGLDELVDLIERKLEDAYTECTFMIPFTDGRAVSYLNSHAVVESEEYESTGTKMKVNCRKSDASYYSKYRV